MPLPIDEDSSNIFELVVIHRDSPGSESLGPDDAIHTGLHVLVDELNQWVVLPFRNEMTAEEVSRILCGIMKRDRTIEPPFLEN